jgi:carboxyl-terminal processing protease
LEVKVNKFLKYTLLTFVAVVLLAGAFSGGFVAGNAASSLFTHLKLPALPVVGGMPAAATPEAAMQSTPTDLQALFTPFWETWDLVHKHYVDQPVDDTKLMQGAISGMLASLGDKHTAYMNPQDYKVATTQLAGNYEGIGAYVDVSGDFMKITKPMPGSPAEKADLRPGDVIIAVDGKDMTGVAPEAARQKVLGPAGTSVTLTIQRNGVDKPFDITLTRASITVPSVEGKMLDNGLAYVKINTFGQTTTDELKTTLQNLLAQKPKGLILDLRYNLGGYLETGIEVASQFIAQGVIVSEKNNTGNVITNKAMSGGLALDIPMVVLVNEWSASASEIVAGAIQDYGRGKLVGVTTYGKGSAQFWIPLSNDQGAAEITEAKWFTPKNRSIDGVGLTPDVVIEMTDADYTAKRDPQLDAAIKTLLDLLK